MTAGIAIYARVSSEKQVQSETIEGQIEALRTYAQTLGYNVDEDLIFTDQGFTGMTLERPALDQLRDLALGDQLTHILILSPDRLARKQLHQILLLEEFRRLEVSILFANQPREATPENRLLLQVLGSIAEYERELILERSRRGRLHKARQGDLSVLSHAPYGYVYVKKTPLEAARYEINPLEAEVVRQIFQRLVKDHQSISAIARSLNAQQIASPGQTKWYRSTIHRILRNPAYMGQAAYRKTQAVPRKPGPPSKRLRELGGYTKRANTSHKRRPTDDWIYLSVPALISSEYFEQAQLQLQQNKLFSQRNNCKHPYLLRGLLRCRECSYRLVGKNRPSYRYYQCKGRVSADLPQNTALCTSKSIRTDTLDNCVWRQIQQLLRHPSLVLQEYLTQSSKLVDPSSELSTLLQRKKKEIQQQNHQKKRLLDLYQTGTIELDAIQARLESLRRNIRHLEKELEILQQNQHQALEHSQLLQTFEQFCSQWQSNLDHLSFDQKQTLIRLLIRDVVVDYHAKQLEITHSIPFKPKEMSLCPSHQSDCPEAA